MRKTNASDHHFAEPGDNEEQVARTMPQNPNSGRPTADAKSCTFHAI
jgi:hypothetical protein